MQNQQNTPQPPHRSGGKGWSILPWLLLIAAIFLNVLVMAQMLGNGFVSLGGCRFFRVVTASMEPEIPAGAMLLTRKIPMEQIAVGDVIAYRTENQQNDSIVIVHRVIQISEDGSLQTRGDANSVSDQTRVKENNYIGKVIFHTKQGHITNILRWFSGKRSALLLIFLPCLSIILWIAGGALKTLRQEMRSRRQNGALDPQEYDALCHRLREELKQELTQANKEQ